MLFDFHCWWSEEFCSQQSSSSWCVSHVLGAVHHWLVTYWDPCKGWRSYIEEFRGSEAVEGFCCKFIYGDVESRDKSFALDMKLLFIIVDCFSRRFPPRFFTVKLVCFIGFRGLSYLVLFTFPLCMILTWYWCLFVLIRFIHNKSN